MKILVTNDIELKERIRKALKDNDGYRPCKLEHIEDNRCMCKKFLEQESGPCHCGLYYKIQ